MAWGLRNKKATVWWPWLVCSSLVRLASILAQNAAFVPPEVLALACKILSESASARNVYQLPLFFWLTHPTRDITLVMEYTDNVNVFGLLHVKYEVGITLQRPAF